MKSLKMLLAYLILTNFRVYGISIDDCSKSVRRTSFQINNNNHKNFVNCWGKTSSGKSELVVLIDGSGSMTQTGSFQGKTTNGFVIAKRFVEALLSEIKIAYNATRIAVGTFSDNHQININYINKPDFGNHKCKFNSEFKNIPFEGGMTNMRGALEDANYIIKELSNLSSVKRRRSNQVVILLTDGYGNIYNGKGKYYPTDEGEREEARKLKTTGYVTLYTVAVTDGANKNLLRNMASHERAYLEAASFNDLAKLASDIRGGKKNEVPFREC